MSLFTSQTSGVGTHGMLPDEIGQLVVQPVRDAAVALNPAVATVVSTISNQFRMPVLTADAAAAWTPEGSEITPDDSEFGEIVVTPLKLAALTVVSRELADDSAPSAQAIVGESLAASIARKVDAAFFAATTADGPDGIASVVGVSEVDTDGSITDLDVFAEAISKAEVEGAQLSSFVTHPDDVLVLSKLKKLDTSNEPLLNVDPTQATRRQILGVPLLSSAAVTPGTIWGVPATKVYVVLREDVRLDVDRSAYFSSDSVAIRATMRAGFAFPHPAAIVRIYNAVDGS
jgi:HK97 family phage major capsid protein